MRILGSKDQIVTRAEPERLSRKMRINIKIYFRPQNNEPGGEFSLSCCSPQFQQRALFRGRLGLPQRAAANHFCMTKMIFQSLVWHICQHVELQTATQRTFVQFILFISRGSKLEMYFFIIYLKTPAFLKCLHLSHQECGVIFYFHFILIQRFLNPKNYNYDTEQQL